MSARPASWRRSRSSARCSSPCRSARRARRSRWPTTPATAWPRASGPRTSIRRWIRARALQAGTVWINSTNLFDASSGFGGYRESGYGREGGLEGLWEYVATCLLTSTSSADAHARARRSAMATLRRPIDRTPKLYIGGKQARPDWGYSLTVTGPNGEALGEVGEGNRKDIRNAVEAARAALPRLGRRHQLQPRPDPLLPGRKPLSSRRRVRPAPRRYDRDSMAGTRSSAASRRCLPPPPGATSSKAASTCPRYAAPRWPSPSRSASSAQPARRPSPCSASSPWLRRCSPWATPSSPSPRPTTRCPPRTCTRYWKPATSRLVSSTS